MLPVSSGAASMITVDEPLALGPRASLAKSGRAPAARGPAVLFDEDDADGEPEAGD
jgi:hypothetical protein